MRLVIDVYSGEGKAVHILQNNESNVEKIVERFMISAIDREIKAEKKLGFSDYEGDKENILNCESTN